MFRVVVAGSRDFYHYHFMCRVLNRLRDTIGDFEVVSGTAKGADKLGERYAEENNLPVTRFPADWSIGKQAGYIRNAEMAKYGDILVAFWNGSNGTKHMIDLAEKEGLWVNVIEF